MISRPMIYPCRWCHGPVDIAPRIREWSELAVWGAIEMLNQVGTICDRCYHKQEGVR